MNSKNGFNRARGFTLVELLVVVGVVAVVVLILMQALVEKGKRARQNSRGNSPLAAHHNVLEGSYSPPILPVTVSVNSRGELNVAASSEVVTPVGAFSASWTREKVQYLKITLGSKTQYYPLGGGRFRVELPNSLKGRSRLDYDGKGNIHITIPQPGSVQFGDGARRPVVSRSRQSTPGLVATSISIANTCSEDISVAILYYDKSERWITEGWWSIESGETVGTGRSAHSASVYFFAENRRYQWHGKGRKGSVRKIVLGERFFLPEGATLPRRSHRHEDFFKVDIGTGRRRYTQRFSCN